VTVAVSVRLMELSQLLETMSSASEKCDTCINMGTVARNGWNTCKITEVLHDSRFLENFPESTITVGWQLNLPEIRVRLAGQVVDQRPFGLGEINVIHV
jgi:hypothetical protein